MNISLQQSLAYTHKLKFCQSSNYDHNQILVNVINMQPEIYFLINF